MSIKDDVQKLIEPALKVLGYDLANVQFLKQGKNYVLRVVIDKDGPVSMDDIIRAGDLIDPLLDEHDLIKTSYLLDITSLGIDKPIAFEKLSAYIDEELEITLKEKVSEKDSYRGVLLKLEESQITLGLKSKKQTEIILKKEQIKTIRLVIKF